VWSDFASTNGLSDLLNKITVTVADLDADNIGSAEGTVITLDPDAAGRGWFVDPTPEGDSEFTQSLGIDQQHAAPDSDAYGLVDLHTVLVHEIGHILGFDHDSALAVMSATVMVGQRIGLNAPGDENGSSVSAAATVGGTVLIIESTDIDPVTVTLTNANDATFDVIVSGAVSGGGDTTYSDVTHIDATLGGDVTLVGMNLASLWELSGADSGSVTLTGGNLTSITFEGIEFFQGGSANDEFHVHPAYGTAVEINSGDGDNTLVVRTGVAFAINFVAGAGTADTIVNPAGSSSTIGKSGVETTIDRPLLFIPGFGGTFADTSKLESALPGSGPIEEWMLNRGIAPDRLVLEPLMEAYSDIVKTFENIGYVDGTNQPSVEGTLYAVLWDYRVPVAQADAVPTNNGLLDDVTGASLVDTTFDTALDYLSYFMDVAVSSWTSLTGAAPDSVDVVTHSTGGLVAKSYIQSVAYSETKDATTDHLLPINVLIQTGVPNQGTGAPYAFLNNDFSLKSATRLLAKILNDTYELHTATNGLVVRNPDGSALVATDEADFVGKYVATFNDLLASYDFLDDVEDQTELLRSLTTSDTFFNNLLADLNANNLDSFVARGQLDVVADALIPELSSADAGAPGDGIVTEAELLALYDTDSSLALELDELPAVLDAADTGNDLGGAPDDVVSYAELLRLFDRQTFIVYSDQVDTADIAIKHTNPVPSLGLTNELLRFEESTLIGRFPGLGETWYELKDNPTGGDGTVSAFSAATGFAATRLIEVSALAGEDVEHTGITHNEISQREIVRLLGVTDHTVANISTDLLLSTAESGIRLITLGIIDPLELAVDLYEETSAKIGSIKQTIDNVLDQPLPIVGQSLNDLIDAELPSLGLGNFFDNLTSSITVPDIGDPQLDLDGFEANIETALGLAAGDLSITNVADMQSTGVITLAFNISRTASTTFDLDLSSTGVLSTTLPVTLEAGLHLEFNISLNIGELNALAGESSGIDALTFELIALNVYGDLEVTGINPSIGFEGLGALQVTAGSIHIRGEADVSLLDPDSVRAGDTPPADDTDNTVTFADLATAGDTPIDLLKIDTSGSVFDVTLPITISADNALVDFSGAGDLVLDVADVFSGSVIPDISVNLGSVLTPASISIGDLLFFEGIINVDSVVGDLMLSDGTLREDVTYSVISAGGVSLFAGVGKGTSGESGVSVSSLDFSLLQFSDSVSGFDYTALNTSITSATFAGGAALSIDVSSLVVELNQTSDTADPSLVLDFKNGATDSVDGISVTPAVGPALDFEGEDGRLVNVSGQLSLNVADVVLVSTGFALSQSGVTGLDDPDTVAADTSLSGDLLLISLEGANLFAGVGASLNGSNDLVVSAGAIGFEVSGVDLDLAILSVADGRSYTGLEALFGTITPRGPSWMWRPKTWLSTTTLPASPTASCLIGAQ
jgi:hypothetical protein